MIRNIVFDMGNVLVYFNPLCYYDLSAEEKKQLLRVTVESAVWPLMDWGVIDEAELLRRIRPRLPEKLYPIAEHMVLRWNEPLQEVPGINALIEELKGKGYGIYVLSNASRRALTYWPTFPVSRFFDGAVFSAPEGYMKPQPELYRILLERYHLKAEESVFIDDRAVNATGALYVGMQAVVFEDAAYLRHQLRELGVDVESE